MIAQGLDGLQEQMRSAMAATKCHRCGCFQETVQALENSLPLADALPG